MNFLWGSQCTMLNASFSSRAHTFFLLLPFSLSLLCFFLSVFSSCTLFILIDTVARSFLLWWMHHDKAPIHKLCLCVIVLLWSFWPSHTHKHEPWCINEATTVGNFSILNQERVRGATVMEEILLFCRAEHSRCQNTELSHWKYFNQKTL